MSATKKSRASKPKRRAVRKTGLVALAAAAMASPVASAPALAQSQTQVSPQPGPTTQELIDERMGTTPPDATIFSTPTERAAPKEIFTRGVGDKVETTPVMPSAVGATPRLSPPAGKELHTIFSTPRPAAPSTKDKALIFTGPSKPSR